MRSEQDLKTTIDKYADTVKRICLLYLKNPSDTEDVFQNVFTKYWNSSTVFENEDHKRFYIIRMTINECKDLFKNFFRKNSINIDSINEIATDTDFNENEYVRNAVLNLPQKNKIPIYLHYFEGYSAVEIANLLHKNVNTIYTLIARGREQLKPILEGEYNEE